MQSDVYLTYPIGLMAVASMLKGRGHEVSIYHDDVSNTIPIRRDRVLLGGVERKELDENSYMPFLDVLDEVQPDVVGMSYCTVDAEAAHALAGFVRQRGIRIVAGGVHPSLLAQDELPLFDAVVVGEGDHPDAAAAFEDPASQIVAPDPVRSGEFMAPDRHCVIGGDRYSPFLRGMIYTQRGCPFACSYCAAPTVFGTKVRVRDAGAVREEVESLGVPSGRIIDDSFGVARSHGLAICHELRSTGFKWVCDMALQTADDPMLDALYAGGCTCINVGLESASVRWRELSGKRVEAGQAESVIAKVQQRGMSMVVYFMVGFPGETIEQMRATLTWAKDLKQRGAKPCISIATPYPGTKLWSMVQEMCVVPLSWDGYHHQSGVMGFADATDDEWARILREANGVNA